MSSIKIKYDELEESSKYAKKLAGELEDYSNRITKRISNPVNSLPGNDKSGYASNIISSASAKIKELNNRSSMFDTYACKVETFVVNAQQADKKVEKAIRSSAESYIGKRSWWQAACDAVYNFLFVDLANSNDVFRFLSDVSKAGWSYVTSFAENARDYFKHGEGKYMWNCFAGVLTIITTAVAIVSAVATLLAGGPFLIIAAAVATIIGGIIAIVNAGFKIYNNGKALKEEDPGVARYVGNISSFSDAVDKYDMGSQKDNEGWEFGAQAVDTVETICGVVVIAKGVADIGAVRNRAGKVYKYKFDKKNMLKNWRKATGYDTKKGKRTLAKLFEIDKPDPTKSWRGKYGFDWFNNMPVRKRKQISKILSTVESVDTTLGTVEKFGSAYDKLNKGLDFSSKAQGIASTGNIAEALIDVYKGLGFVKGFDGINKYITKPGDKLKDILLENV